MQASLSKGAAPSPGQWLEGAVGILDAAGNVTEASRPLRTWLGLGSGSLLDRTSFWERLVQRCPGWEPAVAELRANPEWFASVSVALPAEPPAPAQWFLLERARRGQDTFLRLQSILPPRTELGEGEWDAHLDNPAARRELFVRLLRAEAQLEKLAAHWPGVIFSQRPDFSFDYVSPKIERLTGVPVLHWQRQPQWFWQVVHESDAPELQQQLQQTARTGQSLTSTFRLRHLQSGRITYVLEHRQPVLSQGRLLLGYEGVWLDVTRQTIAEKRLSSAAWKETLAVLTMGLAHDFGNIMAGIHSLSESFLEQLDAAHPFREGLSLIQRNSMQANQLVHRIIHLHLGKTGDRNYHNLNDIVSELEDLVRKITPRRIQCAVELTPVQLPLYVDAVEFRQTIINLALNAADAMAEKGRLEIRTAAHAEWPAPEHVQGVIPRLPCVCLSVADNGCGIQARHLETVFDPFFTTKSANKGSGLGLYNARLFVEKHCGAISVESVEGQGTTFRIWLPQADFTEAERAATATTITPARRLSLLLLSQPGRVLDDTAELLRTGNFHVVTAASPEAAETALRAGDCIYSVLVVLMERDDAALESFLTAVRRQAPLIKTVLKTVGCDRDDFRSTLLRSFDLVVSPDTPDQVFLFNLRATLQPEN